MSKFASGPPKGFVNGKGEESQIRSESDGSLAVTVVNPSTPFGEMVTTSPNITEQYDFVYGIDDKKIKTYAGFGGTAFASSSQLNLSSSSTLYSYCATVGRKFTRYRAGIGTVFRGTAVFSTPVANSLQLLGMAHAEDGYMVGYNGINYGILYRHNGALHIQKFDITTASSTNETVTIVLDGTSYTSSVTVKTGQRAVTAYEIANSGSWTGIWEAYAVSSSIYFIPQLGAPALKTGNFAITASTAVADISVFQSGAATVQEWTYQNSFNLDKLDGTGPSGMTINPQKGNVYQIETQFLGFGNTRFSIEDPETGRYNPFHEIKYANSFENVSLADPYLTFLASVASLGSTTPLLMKVGSSIVYTFGSRNQDKRSYGHINSHTSVGTSFTNVFSLQNSAIRSGKVNRCTVTLAFVGIAVDGTKPAEFKVLKNANFASPPVFVNHTPSNEREHVQICTDKIVVTGEEEVYAGAIGKSGNIDVDLSSLDIDLNRTEKLTIAVRSTSGTTDATVSCTWRIED